jgi:hypothetical protein
MRWWKGVSIVVGLCLAIFAIAFAVRQYWLSALLSQLCENKITEEIVSPNGREKVIVLTHDCGAAGFPQTIVAIVPASYRRIPKHKLPDSRIGAAAWEGYCKVTVRWADDRTVLIEQSGGGGEESSAPKFERVRAETDERGNILKTSPMAVSETWR